MSEVKDDNPPGPKDDYEENLSCSQSSEVDPNSQAPVLNMMDINEIIGVQPDSTLESEIDALSKMIEPTDDTPDMSLEEDAEPLG